MGWLQHNRRALPRQPATQTPDLPLQGNFSRSEGPCGAAGNLGISEAKRQSVESGLHHQTDAEHRRNRGSHKSVGQSGQHAHLPRSHSADSAAARKRSDLSLGGRKPSPPFQADARVDTDLSNGSLHSSQTGKRRRNGSTTSATAGVPAAYRSVLLAVWLAMSSVTRPLPLLGPAP